MASVHIRLRNVMSFPTPPNPMPHRTLSHPVTPSPMPPHPLTPAVRYKPWTDCSRRAHDRIRQEVGRPSRWLPARLSHHTAPTHHHHHLHRTACPVLLPCSGMPTLHQTENTPMLVATPPPPHPTCCLTRSRKGVCYYRYTYESSPAIRRVHDSQVWRGRRSRHHRRGRAGAGMGQRILVRCEAGSGRWGCPHLPRPLPRPSPLLPPITLPLPPFPPSPPPASPRPLRCRRRAHPSQATPPQPIKHRPIPSHPISLARRLLFPRRRTERRRVQRILL